MDRVTGKKVRDLAGHTAAVHALAFSPDGRLLASGEGRAVLLWEVATSQFVRSFRGHDGEVEALALSPDGKALAPGSKDTTALVWVVLRADPDERRLAAGALTEGGLP